jgi:hypothetical protein
VRARLFRRDDAATLGYTYASELDADGADDVWRQLEAEPSGSARRMRPGDVVYVGATSTSSSTATAAGVRSLRES